MKIKYFTNAMVLIEGKETKVLCDPWITFKNKSSTNYYNFPENNFSKEELKKINPDYIYISHSHPDHYDPNTLDIFGKDVKIIIANFKNKYFEKSLKKEGFSNVIIADENNILKISEKDFIFTQPAETSDELDSICYLNIDKKSIINLNDNIENYDQSKFIKNKFGKIDVALLPYCGFGEYPLRYKNLNHKQKLLEAEKKKIKTRKNFVKYIKTLKPEYVIPFAGEVILGGSISREFHNYSGIGTKVEAINYAKKYYSNFKALLMSSGCEYDFKTNKMKGKFVDTIFNSNPKYLRKLEKKKTIYDIGGTFHITKKIEINLLPLLNKAITNINFQRKKRKIKIPKTTAFINTGNDIYYKLDLRNNIVKILKKKNIKDKFYQIFYINYSLLVGMLSKHFVYSNIIEDIDYFRKPNKYDERLHFLMNFLSV